jgi:hypothetical protein
MAEILLSWEKPKVIAAGLIILHVSDTSLQSIVATDLFIKKFKPSSW